MKRIRLVIDLRLLVSIPRKRISTGYINGAKRELLGALCCAGKDSQEGCGPADEPSKVREDRGHGQHDVSQRSVCAAQSAVSLHRRIHLRSFTVCFITLILFA